MKKIMFNKYGLTQAVLEERKTQTRRIIDIENCDYDAIIEAKESNGKTYFTFIYDGWYIGQYPAYQVGEEIAVAQSYKDIVDEAFVFNLIHAVAKECYIQGATEQAEITKQELIEKSVSLYSRSLTEVINMLIKIGKSAGCEELGSIIKFDDSVKIFREKLEE